MLDQINPQPFVCKIYAWAIEFIYAPKDKEFY